ncbi:MAG TPA: phenylalanine--tRNA ligase subunit beta [Myxococcota bacterium]|nr:phenylalanine--tRNA ligase subunit beta [Myxococcota bacterium]
MRVPVSLLGKLVDIPPGVSVEELADLMNGRISEVEGIHRFPSRESFVGVVIARLVEVADSGDDYDRWLAAHSGGSIHLVVGNKHGVLAGQRYAAVLAGSTTPLGEPVLARPVEGLASDGMLLSEATAGIGADAAHPLGFGPDVEDDADPFDALQLDDVVLEFDLEPNRSDLYSLLGMARDVAAIFGTDVHEPPAASTDWAQLKDVAIDIRTENCSRYLALQIHDLEVGPSPQWLQNAVRKLGMRPITNIVDAANLAMLELGQPLHTFDRRQLKTGVIGLRMATDGESITTLDGVQRSLTSECMLVTDGDEPVALAGVMGDLHSEIGDDTTDVLVESAAFDMFTVRRCSRRLALRTEASLRFEKGLPESGVHRGAARLARLLTEVGGPSVRVGAAVDEWPSPREAVTVAFSPDEARARIGMDVPDALIRARFEKLGFEVDESWNVLVPDFRPDIDIQETLNEEVGRIHGYEHVVAELPTAPLAAPRDNPVFTKGFALRRALTGLGFDEVYLGQWIGDAEVQRYGLPLETLLELKNPLVEHYRFFRPSSLPDLVEAVRLNRKSLSSVRLFEIAKIYGRVDGQLVERHHLSGAVAEGDLDRAFYAARDAVLAALGLLGVEVSVELGAAPGWCLPRCFHPSRQAVLTSGGAVIGFLGELHPTLASELDLGAPFTAFHVDFEALLSGVPETPRFTPPPRFPSIEIHVNVLAPARHLASTLLEQVAEVGLQRLVRHSVRDVYAGRGVPEGCKRVTVELEFNHPERSLTQEEVLSEVRRLDGALAGLTVEI